MAQQLEPAASAVVEVASVSSDDRVLDAATGTGNAALIAAERGGQVIGVDFEPALLHVAEERARSTGRQVRWLIGDVTALPVPDESADVVLSVFGVMYSADPIAAADELARVAGPGARVALASWIPGSLMPAMGSVVSAYLPPPPAGSGPLGQWGDPDALGALLEPSGLHLVTTSAGQLLLRLPDVAAATDLLVRTAGHIVSEQERLTRQGRWAALHRDLTTFVEERATQVDDHIELALDYLLALALEAEA